MNNSSSIPYALWLGYLLLASIGSALYGASLTLHFDYWSSDLGAYWVLLSAGCSWLILFGVTYMIGYKKISLRWLIHLSLQTMVYGVIVLLGAALVNVIAEGMDFSSHLMLTPNILLVLFSNILMGNHFVSELRTQEIFAPLAAILWIILLNGTALFFFYLFGKIFG
ncbi:hypothetical protein [Brevibacillus daliensis]|uniref:hypothetical protein n=1 Tax=Brevibacillus daliensis TaxID=2892995 RepID=UPI001E3DB95B|nr:hypothetical protein [Brevibacillus daliensis]